MNAVTAIALPLNTELASVLALVLVVVLLITRSRCGTAT